MLALFACIGVAAVLSVFVARQVSAGGASSAPGSSSPWTGVAELVSAKISSSGAVKETPKQRTWVTASHAGGTRIHVPVSAKPEAGGLFKKFKHPTPSSDGELDFSSSSQETSTQSADSSFTRALPILVVPKYELNGEPLAAPQEFKNLGSRGGVLHVTYTFYDVAQETTTVHFKGFGGKQQTRKVKQPVPIAGELHVTFPKGAMGLSAPGASVKSYPLYGSEVKVTSKDTARATWTFALAPPLTQATHSISYSIRLNQAEVPKAELAAEVITIPPKSEEKSSKSKEKSSHGGGGSGSGGSKSGKSSKGEKGSKREKKSKQERSSKGAGNERSEREGGRTVRGGSERSEPPEGSGSEGSGRERGERPAREPHERSGSARKEPKRLGASGEAPESEAAFEAPGGLGAIPERSATEFANVRTNVATDIGAAAAATRSAIAEVQHRLRDLTARQSEALRGSAVSAETASDGLAEESQDELNGLSSEFASGQAQSSAELGRAVAKATLALRLLERRSSDHSSDLRRHVAAALALSSAATALREDVDALREGAAQHAGDARALKDEIGHTLSDVNALGEHGTPAFTKVEHELTAAEERAQAVLAGASGLEGRLTELAASVGNLQGAAAGLVARAEEIAAAAGAIHETVHSRIAAAVEELETHLEGFKDRGRHLHEQIEAAGARFEAARVRAKAKFAAVKSEIAGHLAALEAKVGAAVGAARAAAQQKVTEAESEYAKLLALVQIGRANNLPSGNATGATVQTGIYLYEIAGSKE
jgi:hypothetical protein